MELSPAVSEKIAELLKNSGLLSSDRYIKITTQCSQDKGKIVNELLKKKFVTEDDIVKAISRNFAIKKFDLSVENVKPEAIKSLPTAFIKKEKIVPFELEGDVLNVAIADPSKMVLLTKIKSLSNKNVNFFVTTFTNIERTISSRIFDISNLPQQKPKLILDEKNKSIQEDKKIDDVSTTNIIQFVDTLFFQGLRAGASDIHIEVFRHKTARIRFRIDGIMQVQKGLSEQLTENYNAVITRLKIMASCDISEQRLPQDGSISVQDKDQGGIDVDVRFNTLPTKFGERIVMRLLRGSNVIELDKIGIPKLELNKFIKAIESPQGMILVTGPTGSGKTTTLYAALQHINNPKINILTAEDPIEYTVEGISQIQANEGIGLTFPNILRSFLRQDPEVILVGEIRDKETVDIALKAALTGHLLLSTLHTRDAVSTIIRLTNMGVPNFMIAGALNMVVAQRLARRICSNCKTLDATINQGQLKELGFKQSEIDKVKVYKGTGCQECGDTGYLGRQGVYEILEINQELQSAIVEEKKASELLIIARKNGFKTLDEIARTHVQNGIISYEEFLRTITISN
jgi:type IV pilus assembly protein PilB